MIQQRVQVTALASTMAITVSSVALAGLTPAPDFPDPHLCGADNLTRAVPQRDCAQPALTLSLPTVMAQTISGPYPPLGYDPGGPRPATPTALPVAPTIPPPAAPPATVPAPVAPAVTTTYPQPYAPLPPQPHWQEQPGQAPAHTRQGEPHQAPTPAPETWHQPAWQPPAWQGPAWPPVVAPPGYAYPGWGPPPRAPLPPPTWHVPPPALSGQAPPVHSGSQGLPPPVYPAEPPHRGQGEGRDDPPGFGLSGQITAGASGGRPGPMSPWTPPSPAPAQPQTSPASMTDPAPPSGHVVETIGTALPQGSSPGPLPAAYPPPGHMTGPPIWGGVVPVPAAPAPTSPQ
ncbi:MAG: hypothetical protein NW217_11150 [Hyphomicrobiaceae bacterium]|nr:hypothetical protein [Hyphomicrobiaceae bacterium]